MRVVILASLAVALLSSPPSSTHEEKQANQPSKQEKKGADSPQAQITPSTSASCAVGQPTAETIDKREAEKQTYWHHVLSPEILPNWLLFFVASIGIYFAWRTLKDLERQTADFHTAAEAAKKSADVSELALQISQRADVLVSDAALPMSHGQDINAWLVRVEFKNFGLTRANNVQLNFKIIIEGKIIPGVVLAPFTMGASTSKTLIFERFPEHISGTLGTSIFRGDVPLRLEALATYQDVFGKNHTTKFLGVLQPRTNTFIAENVEAD